MTLDAETSSAEDPPASSRDGYVLPLVHTRVSQTVADVALWGAVGTVAIAGAIELPVIGAAAAAGLFIRWRHSR
jgi:hypothetical protein